MTFGFRISSDFGCSASAVDGAFAGPLFLGAYALRKFIPKRINALATTMILTVFDVVLDPGAVLLGFWQYNGGGRFYGVPMSNFAGWLVSGLIGSAILDGLIAYFKPLLPTPMQLATSAILIVFFWSMIATFGGLEIPGLIGVAVFALLIYSYSRFTYAFDDKIVFVDEENKAIGTGDKLPSHTNDTKLHRAFSVFLFNQKGEFLMQQRALSKKTWPGVWSNSCCGHVMLHESVDDAARRRIKFELGVTGIDLSVAVPKFQYRAEKDGIVENEICPVLIGRVTEEPRPNPDEIETIRWVNWNAFVASLDDPVTDISPWPYLKFANFSSRENSKCSFSHLKPIAKLSDEKLVCDNPTTHFPETRNEKTIFHPAIDCNGIYVDPCGRPKVGGHRDQTVTGSAGSAAWVHHSRRSGRYHKRVLVARA